MAVVRGLVQRPFQRAFLALLWMALSGELSLSSFVAGFLAATLAMILFGAPERSVATLRIEGPLGFFKWLGAFFHLIGYFLVELVKSVIAVASLAARANPGIRPGVIGMRLKGRSNGQVALTSALITLTPGTLVIGVSEGNEVMYIHTIEAADEAGAMASCRRFDELVAEVLS